MIVTLVLLILLNVIPHVAHSQTISNLDPETDVDAPLDGGIGLLLAVGVGYGLRKAAGNKKKQPTDL